MSEVNVLRGLSGWMLQTCEEMRADPQVLLWETRSREQAGLLDPASSSLDCKQVPSSLSSCLKN